MKILVINGPNINMLGIREKEIYGEKSYADLVKYVKSVCKEEKIKCKIIQSNCEGKIITAIQRAIRKYDGIVINPAGYTHTSVSIADSLTAVNLPYVEVHLSDVEKREDFRKISYVSANAKSVVKGKGFLGYKEAILTLKNHLNTNK